LKLMAILAHHDDESLGFGGVLARYADEGIETSLVTATRGQSGRFKGHARNAPEHPGEEALATIREAELRAAARTLGISDLSIIATSSWIRRMSATPSARSHSIYGGFVRT
jgi:LmbE family N-acetylglucosaminyl deacetylase